MGHEGRSGIGMKKHAQGGRGGPSPRQRLAVQMQARLDDAERARKPTDASKWFPSVASAFANRRRRSKGDSK